MSTTAAEIRTRVDLTERAHHESKAPAHMTRLLDNLSEHQMEKISFLRVEKWRCRDGASDEEVFRLGDQVIDIL